MSEPIFDSTYDYTPALAARFARRELRGRYGGFLIVLVVGAATSLLCLRDSSLYWLSGFVMGLVGAYSIMLIKWYRHSVATAAAYSSGPIGVHIDASGIRLSSPLLNSECPWSSVASVQRVPEGFLLVRKGSLQAVPLPDEALTPDSSAFVVAAVRSAGGRIVP